MYWKLLIRALLLFFFTSPLFAGKYFCSDAIKQFPTDQAKADPYSKVITCYREGGIWWCPDPQDRELRIAFQDKMAKSSNIIKKEYYVPRWEVIKSHYWLTDRSRTNPKLPD